MKPALSHIQLLNFSTEKGNQIDSISLSYELFGPALGTAPVVLVNHALTGNSTVCGAAGWWSDLIGPQKVIDTHKYSILAFNIPGNGYDGQQIENYKDWQCKDVARLFLEGLKALNIKQLFAVIGGSLGGGIAWEMAVLAPNLTQHLIPVASDWKATDWLIANCLIQEKLLLNSSQPVHDARMHAMLCYRTPASFKARFKRTTNEALKIFNVESWLLHHGKKLQERFQVSSYLLMNQLLKSIAVDQNTENVRALLKSIKAQIHLVAVDSDLFFTAEENRETYMLLGSEKASYHEIKSIHGHDAFLIEYKQLQKILTPIFN
ncbi:homoserine O-acetyltransferase [Polaribacter pacificus]|uniref:Homoserine O-acetyltransferase n=1 Tax=Polaribacter pacificus TaxID=1775173 RepID=A0A917HYC8_9FLAO|nr:alpha/beta fold hydrolase [Polaribacter pacificus]GGG95747.1 homoserine O-acetyltransferase [Polaribacter pacificus]